jgi:hypothetical protein
MSLVVSLVWTWASFAVLGCDDTRIELDSSGGTEANDEALMAFGCRLLDLGFLRRV